jgi:hypothetical protein
VSIVVSSLTMRTRIMIINTFTDEQYTHRKLGITYYAPSG